MSTKNLVNKTKQDKTILRHEHDGLVALDQNGAGEMPAHRSRQHQSLQVSTFADHVRHRIAVADASNVLLGSRFEGETRLHTTGVDTIDIKAG